MAENIDLTDDGTSELRKIWKLEADLRESKAEVKRLTAELGRGQARIEVVVAALAAGATPDSLMDIENRANAAGWTMENGRPALPHSNEGPAEWVRRTLRPSAPHLFAQPVDSQVTQSAAPGTQGDGGRPLPTGRANPWSDDGWNDTEQALVVKADPARAAAMAKAAGSYVGALPPSMRKKTAY